MLSNFYCNTGNDVFWFLSRKVSTSQVSTCIYCNKWNFKVCTLVVQGNTFYPLFVSVDLFLLQFLLPQDLVASPVDQLLSLVHWGLKCTIVLRKCYVNVTKISTAKTFIAFEDVVPFHENKIDCHFLPTPPPVSPPLPLAVPGAFKCYK